MGLSANTLFHFTSFENLKNILRTGFYPRCSVELLEFVWKTIPVGVPMVSFCDIKLTQLKEHMNVYDYYGIGLSKKWGAEVGINPVFYIERNSKAFMNLLEHSQLYLNSVVSEKSALKLSSFQKKTFENLLDMVVYCKINQSKRWDKSNHSFSGPDVNFYDEREWRFYPGTPRSADPNYLILPFVPRMKKETFLDALNTRNSILEKSPLLYDSDAIKYIIVKERSEVELLRNYIFTISNLKGTYFNLISKIKTVEELDEDH